MQFCKPSWAVENKTSFVSFSPSLVSRTDTLHQPVKTEKEGPQLTVQTVIIQQDLNHIYMASQNKLHLLHFSARNCK